MITANLLTIKYDKRDGLGLRLENCVLNCTTLNIILVQNLLSVFKYEFLFNAAMNSVYI